VPRRRRSRRTGDLYLLGRPREFIHLPQPDDQARSKGDRLARCLALDWLVRAADGGEGWQVIGSLDAD
jgi:hypothetical protein